MSNTSGNRLLLLQLDGASGVPFYRQIIQQIEHAILANRLRSGEKLPTIRSLAIELKMNPNTVAKAYAELELRGFVTTQVGSGTYVSGIRPEISGEERMDQIQTAVARFLREIETLGVARADAAALVKKIAEEQ